METYTQESPDHRSPSPPAPTHPEHLGTLAEIVPFTSDPHTHKPSPHSLTQPHNPQFLQCKPFVSPFSTTTQPTSPDFNQQFLEDRLVQLDTHKLIVRRNNLHNFLGMVGTGGHVPGTAPSSDNIYTDTPHIQSEYTDSKTLAPHTTILNRAKMILKNRSLEDNYNPNLPYDSPLPSNKDYNPPQPLFLTPKGNKSYPQDVPPTHFIDQLDEDIRRTEGTNTYIYTIYTYNYT